VSAEDHASGRAAEGFTCNAELVGSYTTPNSQGTVGGYRVHRYVDAAGHECAYYDTTLLFPTNAFDAEAGVNVLDMSNPAEPKLTDTLVSPAMLSPHESLSFNERRGLLVAVSCNPLFLPGIVDVYDVSADCRHPVLKSSSPTGIFGHEGNIAPDGRTFYSASPGTETIVAVDISNPSLPTTIATGDYDSHGLTISDDGNRAYVGGINDGLLILDISEVQARAPNPEMRLISSLTWNSMSIPQTAIPITIDGHSYVVEIDEFHDGLSETGPVGAGRVIDISDETNPRVISNLRLEVHQPENFEAIGNDPGTDSPLQGYAGHYCNVPQRVDPEIVACSMILSGLRVFDIRDPHHPREVAYFNAPVTPRETQDPSNYAMSSPAFVPERREIWYTDGFSGFYAVRVTNDVWPASGACNRVRGTRRKDNLRGTPGDDCLRGRRGADRLAGRPGDDQLRGGRGRDRLRGGRGRDVISAAGGGRDRVDCGPGGDKVFVAPSRDRWRRCEKVRR
jgi:hypothetical protein